MGGKIKGRLRDLSLSQKFMGLSLMILLANMVVIGYWVGAKIKKGVITRTASTTALFVESFVAPYVQELSLGRRLTEEHQRTLSGLLRDTPLGQHIVAFKIWSPEGRIVYSRNPANIGRVYPVQGKLAQAWKGRVASDISSLEKPEHQAEREQWRRLLETYSPVRRPGDRRIIAVAEFYQSLDTLEGEILNAQLQSWLIVAAATLMMYLLLVGIVRRGSNTILRQGAELRDRVVQLGELLAKNEELHQRVRQAASRTTALNERFLRRISAELHDGPAQDLGLSLLALDNFLSGSHQDRDTLLSVQTSLQRALGDIRVIAAGLRLPELDRLTVEEVLARVVRVHEGRTKTRVELSMRHLPWQAPLPIKITLYRLVQEGLSNAYRHGGRASQRIQARGGTDYLAVEISDRGPGFDPDRLTDREGHLGLAGMRERIELLGGTFRLETKPGAGTKVIARLPLTPEEENNEP